MKDTNKTCKFVIFSFYEQNGYPMLSQTFYKREYKWQAGNGLTPDSGLRNISVCEHPTINKKNTNNRYTTIDLSLHELFYLGTVNNCYITRFSL